MVRRIGFRVAIAAVLPLLAFPACTADCPCDNSFPLLEVDPPSGDFGNASAIEFRVGNTGDRELVITSVAIEPAPDGTAGVADPAFELEALALPIVLPAVSPDGDVSLAGFTVHARYPADCVLREASLVLVSNDTKQRPCRVPLVQYPLASCTTGR